MGPETNEIQKALTLTPTTTKEIHVGRFHQMKITALDRLFLFMNEKQKQVHRTQGLMWQNHYQIIFLSETKTGNFFTCFVEKKII